MTTLVLWPVEAYLTIYLLHNTLGVRWWGPSRLGFNLFLKWKEYIFFGDVMINMWLKKKKIIDMIKNIILLKTVWLNINKRLRMKIRM